jgi:hypothetical protein
MKYAAQERDVSRRILKSRGPNPRLNRELSRISDNLMGDLRKLSPPASTGVTAEEWRKAIDAMRGDGRAFESFYAQEYPKLLRSLNKPNPKPKLPPGTGPTAAILAQAFNSPEGRRYLRLQRPLWQRLEADLKELERIDRKVRVFKACGDNVHGQTGAATSSQQSHP